MSEPLTADPIVAALLRERANYVNRGLHDRIVAVDAELARRGYVEESPAPPPARTSESNGAPRGRRAPTRRTAAIAVPAESMSETNEE